MLVWKEGMYGWNDLAWEPCITNETSTSLNFVVAYRQSTENDEAECRYEANVPDNYDIHYPLYWRVVYVAQPQPDDFLLVSEYDEEELRETLEMKVKVLGLEELGIERLRSMDALKRET
jgi:hypothetical protein